MTQEIKIDTSQVPKEKQTDPRFLLLLEDTRIRLSDPNERKAICIHEATHILYLSRAGGKDFEFKGPQIVYDAAIDAFDRTAASVKANGFDTNYLATLDFSRWFNSILKAFAGSGVAVEVLMPDRPDNGDAGDLQRFHEFFEPLRSTNPAIQAALASFPDLDSLWKTARKSAKADLTFGKDANTDLIVAKYREAISALGLVSSVF